VEGAIQEVFDIVDAQVLDWTITADDATSVTASTDETVQYAGDGKLIETTVSKTATTSKIEIKNTLTPNLVAGDLVIAPSTQNIGRLGIGSAGQTLRVVNGAPAWATGGSVDQTLVVKFDSGTQEGTDLYTFDGTTQKTIDLVGGSKITLNKVAGEITFNHDDTTRTNTNTTAAPDFGSTFTAVDGVTTDAFGHITAVNLKTVTVPTETTLTKVDTGTGTWLTGIAVDDHEITLSRSNTTEATITVGDLVVSETGAGNGNITIDGALRGPNQFFIDAADSQGAYGQIGGEVVILGDLIVRGVTTTVNSEDVTIKDAFIRLNFDAELENPGSFAPVTNAGIEIERYSETNVRLLWDETDDDWYVTNGIVLQNQQDILNETGAQTFSQFQLFHEGNFVIPMVDQPIDDYSGPVYQGAMVYEVLETITLATTTTTTTGGGGFPPPPE
jgi:hypothetical protein